MENLTHTQESSAAAWILAASIGVLGDDRRVATAGKPQRASRAAANQDAGAALAERLYAAAGLPVRRSEGRQQSVAA